MELDSWFDEYAGGPAGSKFIALEVSDHEDDYDSSTESIAPAKEVECEAGVTAESVQSPVQSPVQTPVQSRNVSRTPSQKPARSSEPSLLNSASAKTSKRWSLISNSSKKRWSSVSFASEERRVSPSTSSKKRRSVMSVTSENEKRMSTASVQSSIASLKRSSTGASLRQMFGKIAIGDEEKENNSSSKLPSGRSTSRPNSRASLQPLNANVCNTMSQRKSYLASSPSMDNVSVISGASVSSVSSKWKFWKKKSDSESSEVSQAYSGPTIRHHGSRSSLKHKSSHSSLQKLKSHRNSVASESISLPMPDLLSRDKLRMKLRNSTSLMSLNSSVITEEFDELQISQLLELCGQNHPLPIEQVVPTWSTLQRLSTHVFQGTDSIFKILPLGQDDFTHSKNMRLKELKLLRLFNGTPGFTQLIACHLALIHGEPTLVCELRHAGISLADTNFSSWAKVLNVWWQCAVIVYAGETKFQFEHRDLQLEHVLVDHHGNVTICDYKLSRASQGSFTYYTRLDHPLFFQGRGDYRYDVYNTMRHWSSDSPARFNPRNNLLWLHYIGVKLLKQLSHVPSDQSHAELRKLVALVDPYRRKRSIFRRSDDISNCGDLLRLRS
ncbi:LAFE_0D03400g1_1 [Lachancea fermentati]|uniref:non-specific serine/threonine protein kinase n=1 Tax=Lachancea fermentati TaxID=4955 RepID=A0A1G4MBD8_LACFM|nr:LAFE_0D03400g1_1 [Lachancea fermentati]